MATPDPDFNPYQPPVSALEVKPEEDPEALVPWEDKGRFPGFWARVGEMFSLAFKAPTELFRRVPSGESLGAPWRFTMVMASPVLILAMFILLIIGLIAFPAIARDLKSPGMPPLWVLLMAIPVGVALLPAFYFVQIILWGLVNHASLWLWGGLRNGHPVSQTIRATGYATGFFALGSMIPLLNYVVMILVPVILGMGLARMHRTDTWRGICAALTPLLLCCCTYAGILGVAFISTASRIR